jgi:glycosyltransferase involved in cell wall biosynthesis
MRAGEVFRSIAAAMTIRSRSRNREAQVTEHAWQGFGPQKNLALSLAMGEWVLSIDADERVTRQLAVREVHRRNRCGRLGNPPPDTLPRHAGAIHAAVLLDLRYICVPGSGITGFRWRCPPV